MEADGEGGGFRQRRGGGSNPGKRLPRALQLSRGGTSAVEPDGEGGGSRGGGVEAAGIRRRNVFRLALCDEVEAEVEPLNFSSGI